MIIAICSEKPQKHSYFTVAESDLQLHWNLHFMSSLIIFKYFRNYVFFALPALHVSPSKVVTLPSGIPHFGPKNTESEHAPTGVLDPLNRNSLSWWGGGSRRWAAELGAPPGSIRQHCTSHGGHPRPARDV